MLTTSAGTTAPAVWAETPPARRGGTSASCFGVAEDIFGQIAVATQRLDTQKHFLSAEIAESGSKR